MQAWHQSRTASALVALLCAATAGFAADFRPSPDRILEGVPLAPVGFTACSAILQVGPGAGPPGSAGNPVRLSVTAGGSAALSTVTLTLADIPDRLEATGCNALVPGFVCTLADGPAGAALSIHSPTSATIPAGAVAQPLAEVAYSVGPSVPFGPVTLPPGDASVAGTGGAACALALLGNAFEVGPCILNPPDTDLDGTPDCLDLCPEDPAKIAPGQCGCGASDYDGDSDGTADCLDLCPIDPFKTEPGQCGCGVRDTDNDADGTANCLDGCPTDPFKTEPGDCGCGAPETDEDGDGVACGDLCPEDPFKSAPGACGCGVPDTDSDGDGAANCIDGCPADPLKTNPGFCGCGVSDADDDGDGTPNCFDGCPTDPQKIAPGVCGCGVSDADSDGDGRRDCLDPCPADAQDDVDQDGLCADEDNCDTIDNPDQADSDGDGLGDVCDIDEDLDGVPLPDDCDDGNPEIYPGAREICGNGIDEDCSGADAYCGECAALPRDGWTVPYADSEELVGENGSRVNAIDGNPLTNWVTQWVPTSSAHPHEIVVDSGSISTLCGFSYLPRQDGGTNGTLRQYEFATSVDGANWVTVESGLLFNDASALVEREIEFAPRPGRFVRLRSLSAIHGGPWAVVAELGIHGITLGESEPPIAIIEAPATDTAVASGGAIDFRGSGSDPDEERPLSFSWTFPGCAIPSTSPVAEPGPVVFACPTGSYTATFVVCDAAGACAWATRQIAVNGPACAELSLAGASVTYADSQQLVVEDGAATNAIDGNPLTHWVTQWIPQSPAHPHEIRIDTGAVRTLCDFRYLPRQDGGVNGTVRGYEFAISADGTTWVSVSSGELFTNTSALVERQVAFAPIAGRHVRFRSLGEVNGGPWAVVAELGLGAVSAGSSEPPLATIDLPTADITIDSGAEVEFAGSASDPDGELPLSLSWSFPACASPSSSNSEDPGPVVFVCAAGSYPVTLTVCDAVGLCTMAQRNVTVVGPQCGALPRVGWSVAGVDSEELVGENGRAANAIDGNPGTIWVTQWVPFSPGLPHRIEIDLGASALLCGFTYLPRQDGGVNGSIRDYELEVSADGENWRLAARGVLVTNATGLVERQVDFPPTAGRFVRLRALGEVNGGPWTTAAEIGLRALGD